MATCSCPRWLAKSPIPESMAKSRSDRNSLFAIDPVPVDGLSDQGATRDAQYGAKRSGPALRKLVTDNPARNRAYDEPGRSIGAVAIIATVIAVIDDLVIANQAPLMMAMVVAIIEPRTVVPVMVAMFVTVAVTFLLAVRILCPAAMGRRPGRRIGHDRQRRKEKGGNNRHGNHA